MPIKYKLLHFHHSHGKAELCRLILHCSGVSFEDHRSEHSLSQTKHDTPLAPLFEVDDGHMLAQSNSIARFLARQHGLAGKSDWEQCQADMYVDCIEYLHSAMIPVEHETDPERQRSMFEKVNDEKIQPFVQRTEQHLKSKGTVYLVGDAITWADIAYYAFFTSPIIARLAKEVLAGTPRLEKLVEDVGNVPRIKKYVESRHLAAH